MLTQLLRFLSSVHVELTIYLLLEQGIPILFEQASRRFFERRAKTCPRPRIGGEDRISALPDDLLVQILLLVPTKDAVSTMFLSKRWRFIWTMVPKLEYLEINDDSRQIVMAGLLGRLLERLFGKSDPKRRCIWRFLDKSLQLHKAHVLEKIFIQLGPQCPVDVDVGKLIENVIDRKVRELGFMLSWSNEPISLPKSLYTCTTLVSLGLSHKIFVDVPSTACLPSLKGLGLYSLLRFLSSCPILKHLVVQRHYEDNVTKFNINVPSLECLSYDYVDNDRIGGTLVIDSPALKKIFITDHSGDSCLIENKPRFDKAKIDVVCYLGNKSMRSLSSVTYLELVLNFATVACCKAINFSQLMECKITLVHELDWLEPLMLLLQNSPKLKVIFIDQTSIELDKDFSLSWNQPNHVQGCLSTHLEIFEWKGFEGRNKEKEVVRYIFANSKLLQRAGISMKTTCKRRYRNKITRELESMPRISTSSQLHFTTQLEYLSVESEMTD